MQTNLGKQKKTRHLQQEQERLRPGSDYRRRTGTNRTLYHKTDCSHIFQFKFFIETQRGKHFHSALSFHRLHSVLWQLVQWQQGHPACTVFHTSKLRRLFFWRPLDDLARSGVISRNKQAGWTIAKSKSGGGGCSRSSSIFSFHLLATTAADGIRRSWGRIRKSRSGRLTTSSRATWVSWYTEYLHSGFHWSWGWWRWETIRLSITCQRPIYVAVAALSNVW